MKDHPYLHRSPPLLLATLRRVRFAPRPMVARTVEDIIAARGVKPTLSPNLNVLATVEALAPEVKRLLFIGVGCQVRVKMYACFFVFVVFSHALCVCFCCVFTCHQKACVSCMLRAGLSTSLHVMAADLSTK